MAPSTRSNPDREVQPEDVRAELSQERITPAHQPDAPEPDAPEELPDAPPDSGATDDSETPQGVPLADLEAENRRLEEESRRLAAQERQQELRRRIAQQKRQVAARESEAARLEDASDPDTTRISQYDSAPQALEQQPEAQHPLIPEQSGFPLTYRPKAPSVRAIPDSYYGRTLIDYRAFMARIENHHDRFADYFSNDFTKVTDTASYLSQDLMVSWSIKKGEFKTAPSWKEFTDFLRNQLNSPDNLRRSANHKYQLAKQLNNQPVRAFADYLRQHEEQLEDRYTDNQRKNHLRARVHELIQREMARYSNEPESYEAFVSHLQTIEDNIPERREAKTQPRSERTRGAAPRPEGNRSGRSAGRGPSGRGGSRDSSRAPPRGESEGRKRPRSDTGGNKCYNCGKMGHFSRECWSKRGRKNDDSRDDNSSKNEKSQ
jgi:hypothetical protein